MEQIVDNLFVGEKSALNISNSNLSKEQLLEKKEIINTHLKYLQDEITKIGISKNQIRYKPHTVNQYQLLQRDKLAHECNIFTREIIDINKYIRILSEKPDYFREIVKNNFPSEIYNAINEECNKRERGEQGFALKFNFAEMENGKQKIYLYQRTLREFYDALLAARQELTKYMELNCPEGNGEDFKNFIRNISPVNQNLPSVDSLQRKKRNIGF